MKYIYHYHATIVKSRHVTSNLDGILSSTLVNDKAAYKLIKKKIADYYKCGYNAKDICIESLSLLHTE